MVVKDLKKNILIIKKKPHKENLHRETIENKSSAMLRYLLFSSYPAVCHAIVVVWKINSSQG